MKKIDLDSFDTVELLFKEVLLHRDQTIVFYNSFEWNHLNQKLVFQTISFISKLKFNINYFFYNIPFCVFKSFWHTFIKKHCIFNKLCNSYPWYHHFWKCTRCIYGLFCNNFNQNIPFEEKENLEWFYDQNLINRDFILNILSRIADFFYSLWYSKKHISFYITQKYIYDFLVGDIDSISEESIRYLIVYVTLWDFFRSKKYFKNLKWSILVPHASYDDIFTQFVQKMGIPINMSYNTAHSKEIIEVNWENNPIRINSFYSKYERFWKRLFFDFSESDLLKSKNITLFKGLVYNPQNLELIIEFQPIQSPKDAVAFSSEVYVWRDLILWTWINTYKGIILTYDGESWQRKFFTSFKSIDIPVIYDVSPNISQLLTSWDVLKINFQTWVIQKI